MYYSPPTRNSPSLNISVYKATQYLLQAVITAYTQACCAIYISLVWLH